MKRPVLKKAEFVCPVCAGVRVRGVFVRLTNGVIVKVCKKESCREDAKTVWENSGGLYLGAYRGRLR